MSITHVLADGTEIGDISGHVVREENKDFYQVVEKIIREA
ncbi:MAG: BOW99_gp33 family protein [Lachnospiraceae bacterium]